MKFLRYSELRETDCVVMPLENAEGIKFTTGASSENILGSSVILDTETGTLKAIPFCSQTSKISERKHAR
ncbi:hypothetical protein [Aequorivita viscosa]|uniref:hypothetical protein n=1 Tax=Aequorivita viscosa TaxID=797419 RepID=UPI00115FB751|nr:hypothetical protein [Aequorivita viscosa]